MRTNNFDYPRYDNLKRLKLLLFYYSSHSNVRFYINLEDS